MNGSAGHQLLVDCLAYPRSMAAALFKPARLYDPESAVDYSPPLVALILSLVMYFVGAGIVARAELAQPGGVEFPSLGAVVAITVWILLVLAAVRGTLAWIFELQVAGTIRGVGILLWPISVGLLAYGVLVIVAVWLPDNALAVAATIDSGFRDLPDGWAPAMAWTHAVSTASLLPVLILSGWALFNVIRGPFRATHVRAVLASVTAMAVVLGVSFLLATVVWGITRQLYFWTHPG